uniref:Reverse transcriptase domain-containing protein n=1 Tax=Amphimedon queenslandica TaxID=400682 RepID=A0A1X7UPP0_AMPQE
MPFGLRNAAETFQRFIDRVLHGLTFTYAYIDDVLVASTNEEEHKKHFTLVFESFRDYGVVINPNKCELGKPSLELLGHIVDKNGIRPVDSKVAAVKNFLCPKTQRQLQKFLGMTNFYHRFLPNVAKILNPLHPTPHSYSF